MVLVGCAGAGDCANDLPARCPVVAPSYASSVSGIVAQACGQGCHQPGGVAANRRLDTYADLYRQRSAVLNQAYSCTMPPVGSPQLSAEERRELFGWLVCGAPDN